MTPPNIAAPTYQVSSRNPSSSAAVTLPAQHSNDQVNCHKRHPGASQAG
jgi:hypothetical protein